MKKITLFALLFPSFSAIGVSLAQAADYYIDGYQENCPIGPGGVGIISIGNGRFVVTDGVFERQSKLVSLGDGWSQADYAVMYEGEPGETESIKLRITDADIEIRHARGERYTGRRCR